MTKKSPSANTTEISGNGPIYHELDRRTREDILPRVLEMLQGRRGYSRRITNKQLRDQLEECEIYIGDAQVRDIIHSIRVSGEIPMLISNSRGYYIASTMQEIKQYVLSLRKRETAIHTIRMALTRQMIDHYGQPEHTFIDEDDPIEKLSNTKMDW